MSERIIVNVCSLFQLIHVNNRDTTAFIFIVAVATIIDGIHEQSCIMYERFILVHYNEHDDYKLVDKIITYGIGTHVHKWKIEEPKRECQLLKIECKDNVSVAGVCVESKSVIFAQKRV